MNYFFWALGVIPPSAAGIESPSLDPDFVVARRWAVGIWDWAYLQTKGALEMPYTVADQLAGTCNTEFKLSAHSREEAVARMRELYIGLLLAGAPPFPVVAFSNHSINDYSNFRTTDPSDPRYEAATVVRENLEEVFVCRVDGYSGGLAPSHSSRLLTEAILMEGQRNAERVHANLDRNPKLSTLADALVSAPQITDPGMSVLLLWAALESLFPKLQAELSFRLSLMLALLDRRAGALERFRDLRAAYGQRSRVAHGSRLTKNGRDEREVWTKHWEIAMGTSLAILERETIPDEEELMRELLTDRDGGTGAPPPPPAVAPPEAAP